MNKLYYGGVQKTHNYMTVLTILTMISTIFISSIFEPQLTQVAGGDTTIFASREKEEKLRARTNDPL